MKKHHYQNPETRRLIFQKYDGRCAYCGDPLEERFTVDHIDPLKRHIRGSKSHLEILENYNPCCQSCNSSKSDWTIEQWRDRITLKYNRLMRDSSGFRLLVRMGIVEKAVNKVSFYFERIDNGKP